MLARRDPIRDDIATALKQMISSGALSAGSRLKEFSLAEDLGVGRSPVREALLVLERDGYVVSEPNKGCSVAPVTAERISEAYSVCGALEALAIRRTATFTADHIAELDRLNAAISTAKSKVTKLKYDLAWHQALSARCHGERLSSLVENARTFASCFDGGQRRGIVNASRTVAEHDAITRALASDDRGEAVRLIEDHWAGGVETVVAWLRENNQLSEEPAAG